MSAPTEGPPVSHYVRSVLPFSRRYLEAVLDCLLADFARRRLRPQWWPPASLKHLTRSATLRRERWKSALPGDVAQAAFPPADADISLKDEATWQIARHLKRLYETISADELEPGLASLERLPLVELPDDRYLLDLGVSALPSATVRAALPASAWDTLLTDLSNHVFTDFLLWLLKQHYPAVTTPELFERIGVFVRRELERRRRLPEGDWTNQWTSYASSALDACRAESGKVSGSVQGLRYEDLDASIELLLSHLPADIQRDAMLRYESQRRSLLEDALASELLSRGLPDEPGELFVLRYLSASECRVPFEAQSASRLITGVRGATWEVVLPIRGHVEQRLATDSLGFTFTNEFPVPRLQAPQGAVTFAHFQSLSAASQDEAAHEARRRLTLAISAVGVFSRTPLTIEILDAHTRVEGAVGWGYVGRRTVLPLTTPAVTDWQPIFAELDAVLRAPDDLAERIREALIHLHRGEASYDAEDRLDEAWKVLEIIGEYATRRAEALLCYLPLYFVSREFKSLNSRKKLEVVKQKYRRTRDAFVQVKEARNKAIAHRSIARADWKVLGHHSEWVLAFARQVLIGAFVGWTLGARRPRELAHQLRRAYEKNFHFRPPNPSELRE